MGQTRGYSVRLESMEAKPESGLTDYFAAFRRRRWLIVSIGVPIFAAAAMLAVLLPSYFASTAAFRFDEAAVDTPQAGQAERNNYLDEYVTKLEDTVLSPQSLVKLRDTLHLPPEGEGALATMQKKIHVEMTTERILDPESGRQKDVNSGFTVRYDLESAENAQQASLWLADQFLTQSRQNRHDRAMQAANFLQSEADKYHAQISVLESKLAVFKQLHAGELPESTNVNQGEKERAEADLINVEQELSTLRQNRIFLQTQLQQAQAVNPDTDALRQLQEDYNRKLATYDVNHPDMIAMRRQIAELQRGGGVVGGDSLQVQLDTQKAILAQTRERYSEDHPDVKRLERLIASLEARIAAGEKAGPSAAMTNPIAVQLQTQLNANDSQTAALLERRNKINAKLTSIASQVAASPQVEKDYQGIVRDLQLARDKYDELLKRKMDSEVTASGALAGSGDEFHLLQPPGKALPSNKSKAAITIIGMLLAVVFAFGAVLAREAFDRSVRGSNDLLGILGVVPLAIVPEIRNSRYRTMSRLRLTRFAVALVIGLPVLYTVLRFAVR